MSVNYTVLNTIAPSLPIAQQEYSAEYETMFLNVLRLYFNQIDNFTQNVTKPAHGTTANRPTVNLQIGTTFFDTTLGIPIWYKGTVWVNSSGATV